jgi:PAS domain S-box-containing protein
MNANVPSAIHDQSLLTAIANSSDDAIIARTLDAKIISWNPAATKIFGYSEAEALGRSIAIPVASGGPFQETELFRSIANGECLRHVQSIRAAKDGTNIHVSANFSPLTDRTGAIMGVLEVARDVGGQLQLQHQLNASEAAFQGMFEQVAMGVAHISLDGRFLLVNQRYADILGRTRAQLLGAECREIVHPQDFSDSAVMIQRLVDGDIPSFSLDQRCLLRNDASVWVTLTASLVRPGSGDPSYILAIVEDIDARKQIELLLRESEERFRSMANSISQLAWIAREDGHIYWYNTRWYEYTGTTPEQMAGWGWQSVHHPDVLPRVLQTWAEAIAAGKSFEMEFPLRGADGEYRTFLTRSQPLINANGNIVQWVGTNTDVESLKQVEQRTRFINLELEQRVAERTAQLEAANVELQRSRAEINSIFESLPGLYLVLTPDLTIVSASDAYLDATMTTRSGIIGRKMFDVFPQNPQEKTQSGVANLRASFGRVLRNAVPDTMAIQKYDIRRPDGAFEEHYWSPINSPVFGADGRIKYIVHRVQEVTDFMLHKIDETGSEEALSARLQQMEAEVFRSSQSLEATCLELEAANKELEAFTYSVSHDLRAPLRGVDGYIRMLQEDFASSLNAEGNRMLGVVSSEALRMGRLIDDLLAFSRLGRQSLDRMPIDMLKLASECFNSAAASASPKPQLELKPLPPAHGDLAMLRQVFANLIGNAIKFSAGQSTPLIEIGSICEHGEHVYYVKDNGVGFDQKYGHKLFAVFQRLHSEEEFEGTGVGLALVQRVLQRHGGKVWAQGTPGRGATFFFCIPNSSEKST